MLAIDSLSRKFDFLIFEDARTALCRSVQSFRTLMWYKTALRKIENHGAMNNRIPVCPKHDGPMVPHIPYPKDVSYPQGYIRFRCPNLDCPIVYEGAFDGLYVLERNGKLKLYDPAPDHQR